MSQKKAPLFNFSGHNRNRHKWMTATRLIVLGFLCIIFVGAALLMLPFATKDGHSITFMDALFTSASATCVTGLAVFNVYETLSIFGQIVLLLLIQLGGIGFMSLTSFVYLLFSKRVTLSYRLTMKEDIAQGNVHYIKRTVKRILTFTAISETAGAIVLIGAFSRYMSAGDAIWNGIFHSVSAFCNAGFDIIGINGGGTSMSYFSSDPLVLLSLAILIILGGIGFLVVSDMLDAKTWRHYRLHTKIVLCMTLALVLGGTIFYLGVEYNNPQTLGNMNFGDKLLNALFQSVSARTAGFNSVNIASLTPASIVFTDFLMFIGANAGSTGGGIKTTTLFVLVVMVYNVIKQRRYSIVDKQMVGATTVHRASSVFVLAFSMMIISTIVLSLSDGANFDLSEILFEQISAYATAGLSLGITSGMSVVGKLMLILNMFMGRVGVLTFFISFTRGKYKADGKIKYPECSIDL